jgi:hypothetical protein
LISTGFSGCTSIACGLITGGKGGGTSFGIGAGKGRGKLIGVGGFSGCTVIGAR